MMDRTDWPPIPAKYFTSLDGCSCPDWRYRGHIRPCKHVSALRDAVAVLEANAAKWASVGVDNRQAERMEAV